MPRAIWSGVDQLRAGQHPGQAVQRRVPQERAASTRSTPAPASRIKHKKVSAADGDEVPYEAIVKGYELSSGDYVTVSDDELAALDPEASRTIDIEEFVDLVDIDPLFYDSAYYVAPDKATTKPYALLTQAMEESGKVGIARFVMRTKQYLCAVRPKDGALVLSTMVYADEVNDADGDRGDRRRSRTSSSPRRSWTWRASSSSRWPPTSSPRSSTTPTANQVLGLIERKAAGDDGDRRPAGGDQRGQGRRPHGRPRGQRQGGQGGPQAPPGRRRRPAPSEERRDAREEARRASRPSAGRPASSRSTGASSRSPTSTRCCTRRRVHQGRGHRLLRAHRAGDAAAHRRPRRHACAATRTGSTRRRSSRSAARRTAPSGSAPSPVPATATAPSATAPSTRWPALAWSANMAALEIHAPMARGADIDAPTMCVFDLDPGPPTGIPECAEVALDIRDVLDDLPGSSASRRRRARRGCSSTCRSTRRTPTSTAPRSRRPSPRCSRSTTRRA